MEREEALNAIRKYKENWLDEIQEAIETLIPELRESEDEITRKRLINLIRELASATVPIMTGGYFIDGQDKRYISYLEKQKEQPKEELVYRLNGLMQEYIKEGKDVAEKEHRFKCYQLFWDTLEDASYFEQKEQKPAEWSEEDEKMRSLCIAIIQSWISKEDRDRCLDWLKSLRPSWKPSEEQMEALLSCSSVGTLTHRKTLKSLYNDLKKQ